MVNQRKHYYQKSNLQQEKQALKMNNQLEMKDKALRPLKNWQKINATLIFRTME